MIHQFTALILSCLMLVVSATSQVGLHFCLCEKTVFMGDCPCDQTPEKEEVAPCSCCESCDAPDETLPETQYPCDDCNLTIDLEFGDCVPQSGSDMKVSIESSVALFQVFVANNRISLTRGAVSLLEIHGGLPPHVLCETTPLYLRHSVFQI